MAQNVENIIRISEKAKKENEIERLKRKFNFNNKLQNTNGFKNYNTQNYTQSNVNATKENKSNNNHKHPTYDRNAG